MSEKKGISKIFFGWWIVLTGGILTFWGQGFGNFGFSVLFKPLSVELGFSRAETSVAASLGKFEGGILSPVVGWLTDKFGPRWMVICGVSLLGLGLILMSQVHSLWALYVVWGVIMGTGANVGFSIPLDKTIANWFVKKRGRAIGAKFMFNAACAVFMVPLIGWIVSQQGWRIACTTGGIVMLVVGLPLAWLFIRQKRPEFYGLLPDGATTLVPAGETRIVDRGVSYAQEVEEIEFTLRQAIKTPAYWCLMLSIAGWQLVGAVFVLHGVPLLSDLGYNPVQAALMVGLMSAGVIPGALISMSIADHMRKNRLRFIIASAYFLQIAGLIIFLIQPNKTTIFPMFVTHHFAAGLSGGMSTVMMARYFGRKAFASIRGTILMLLLPFSVGGPIFAGWVYDIFGNYTYAFSLCLASVIMAMTTALLAFPPKPPAKITGIDSFF